jgi:pimeloyl-ACP methyl ester carboxylesterase
MRSGPDTSSAGAAPPVRPLVLLHGLGRTRFSMWRLARRAAARGYSVHNVGYRSRRSAIAEHAERIGARLAALAGREGPLDAVTHSLGGIVLRAAVAAGWLDAAALRRVVMLAPPNAGSELADVLSRTPLFRLAVGPAGPQLATGEAGVAASLPPVPFETGVIAGARAANPLFGRAFAGPNDGKVSVERAAVAGMRDFVTVPCGHTFIMDRPDVVRQIFRFLADGEFARDERSDPGDGRGARRGARSA